MSGLLGGIISAIGNIGGALFGSSGAQDAAETTGRYNLMATEKILAAQEAARKELREAAARGLGYIDTGVGRYETTINPLLTPEPIVMPTYRGLTPQQELGREDLNRNSAAMLASSGLRGAGRSGVAAAMDADRRFLLAARGANDADTITERRRAKSVADSARSGLASLYPSTGIAKANTELTTGTQIGNSLAAGGNAAGNLLANTGSAYANAANTSGNLWGNAITGTANVLGQSVGNWLGQSQSPNAGGGYVDTGTWDVPSYA